MDKSITIHEGRTFRHREVPDEEACETQFPATSCPCGVFTEITWSDRRTLKEATAEARGADEPPTQLKTYA